MFLSQNLTEPPRIRGTFNVNHAGRLLAIHAIPVWLPVFASVAYAEDLSCKLQRRYNFL